MTIVDNFVSQIDWGQVDTVMLDMDGTLLDLHFDYHFWCEHMPLAFATKEHLELDQALEILNPIFKKHEGTLNWYCPHFWSDMLGIDIMYHKSEVADKIGFRPKARAFLRACQQHSKDVRLVTNAHRDVLNLKIEKTQIDQHFHTMRCSHELNYPKEHVNFWVNLNSEASFNPSRTLFIDDSESVLNAASQYGIEQLYSIAKPDSRQMRAVESRFPMINSF